MTGITLPYTLQDGQKAYAARLMADLEALAAKLNSVSLPGLATCDMETALQKLKQQLDEEYAADAKVVSALDYDSASQTLRLQLRDGALFTLSMQPFSHVYTGADSDSCTVSVAADDTISAEVRAGSVTYAMLATALQALLNGKVTAGSTGNASHIVLSDGVSLQTKLDSGDLNGADAVSVATNAMYYFRVGDDGHLYVGVPDAAAQPPLAINTSGHLIFTID